MDTVTSTGLVDASILMSPTSTGLLVEKFKYLVYTAAIRCFFPNPKCQYEDLVQYGYIGLLEALPKIDWSRSPPAYLYKLIRYAIMDGLTLEGLIPPIAHKRKAEYLTDVSRNVYDI